jgi:cation transport regulator ChaC
LHIFGYGSLVNPRSIRNTLGEELREEEVALAILRDYVRKWQLVDWVQVEHVNQGPTPAIFLDLVPQQGAVVNGVLLPISPKGLSKMDQREKNYDRIDVSALIHTPLSEEPVFTYVGKREHCIPPPGSFVLTRYEQLVEEGIAYWGEKFADQFRQTTMSHQYPRQDGKYIFVDKKQNIAVNRK